MTFPLEIDILRIIIKIIGKMIDCRIKDVN